MSEKSECPNGCGKTMEPVKRDRLFTGPNGERVIGEDLTFYVCSVCGEEGTPPETMELIEKYFSGELEPDEVYEAPVIHQKTA